MESFLAKKLLPLQTIAIEPPRGWRGAMSNQSFKAFKWLAWQESKLRKTPHSSTGAPQADRIQHAGHCGEVRVLTPGQSFLVDTTPPLKRYASFAVVFGMDAPYAFLGGINTLN